jgi:beta-barrel assembly-enhancing protease
MRRAFPVLALLLSCCAPHSQPPTPDREAVKEEKSTELALAYDHEMDKYEQLRRVSYRLSVAAADFCGTHIGRAGGFIATSIGSVPERYRPAAHQRYPGLGDPPMVIYVVPGSAAEAAGLKEGDVITELDGEHVSSDYKVMANFTEQLRKAAPGPLHLTVRRAGSPVDATLEPVRSCNYPFHIVADPSINAFADGEAVYVMDGMMEFVRSDDELAEVLGHEMTHDFRGHIDARHKNIIAGLLVGMVIDVVVTAGTRTVEPLLRYRLAEVGALAFSKQFEAEADYIGLYVMARAGYKIDDAAQFWRRMAVAEPGTITMARDHPPTPERFVALTAAIAEIKTKEARGAPLVPNEKHARGGEG